MMALIDGNTGSSWRDEPHMHACCACFEPLNVACVSRHLTTSQLVGICYDCWESGAARPLSAEEADERLRLIAAEMGVEL